MADFDIGSLLLLGTALLGTGVIAGIIAGLLGVGGGIVIVPVLYHMLLALGVDEQVVMHIAVGTSLATILGTGTSSALAHYRRGGVDVDLLKRWWLPIAIGVVTGSIVGGNVSGNVLSLIFATVALAVALNMILRKDGVSLATKLPGTPIKETLGFFIGSISVMMGIGGGTLSVPILTLFSYPIRLAVGTASAIGLLIAVPGTIGAIYYGLGVEARPPWSLGYVNLIGFLLIIPASTLSAPLGARIAHTINPRALKIVFALFLAFTGLRMFYDVLL
ncbi:sulfite exporter TauE/SafE family protein [Stappia sp. F7233]|uniref:Probable membrane transporter protein n=1 Tax=Stappia albiluteola TaxID=2758565 RepID=A0A839ABT9_9HYPH|nr:sulfite exporter TauE/SafE family protein [Stappia albiluteola]MBA5776891.1 sulfite exporter TauE/SafE family protein [Stappia albiluteola]